MLDEAPIHLTDLAGGVAFDVDGDGVREPVAWSRTDSTTAFLVLDLDENGAITTGRELFGMPVGAPRRSKPLAGDNSFTLLAAYDDPANGGNGDGIISAGDGVFGQLRLWVDGNHDGVSQPGEFLPLDAAGVVSIEFAYERTGRRAGLGNNYRYRGVVHLASEASVTIWDVFLATAETGAPQVAALEQRGFAAGVGYSLRQVGAWVRRVLTQRPVSALTGPRAVGAPVSWAKSSRFWPADSGPLAQAGPASTGESELVDEIPAPAMPQDPPSQPTQVVEYYHLDMLGSVRAVTDEQGNVIARHDFEPFGEEVSPQNPPKDRKLFTGQERDFETGLDDFNARQYRPDLGQFTSPDPISVVPEPIGALELGGYTYVGNNPLASVDPTGMFGIDFGSFTSGFDGLSFWLSFNSAMFGAPGGWFGGGSTYQVRGGGFAPTFSTGGALTGEFGAMWTGAAIVSQAGSSQPGRAALAVRG